MTKSNSENETPSVNDERGWDQEEWDRRMKKIRELLQSAKRHREAAEYWNAIARSERRRGIFR